MGDYQTDAEAIAAVQAGRRCRTRTSLHEEESHTCAGAWHWWRVVACDGATDVLECARCGRLLPAPCDFDEDHA